MERERNALNRMKISVLIAAVMLVGLAGHSFLSGVAVGQTGWAAPAKAKDTKNPVKADAASIKKGKELFAANCVLCHGAAGGGDGVMAAKLKPKPAVLHKQTLTDQTDGELFWKITEGKPPMPSFKAIIPEKDRWSVVNYLRTL